MISYSNATDAYEGIIRDVLSNGYVYSPRGKSITEICGYQFLLKSYDNPIPLQKDRRLNYRFAILEGLCNILGEYPTDLILGTNKRMREFMNEETQTWNGAYAPRLRDALIEVYELLKKDRDTRQAVLPIFSFADSLRLNTENIEWKKDLPCTLSLQFLIREKSLNMIVTMRSNDVMLGLPYDMNQFCMIGYALASWLNIKTGWYLHNAGSMHIYDDTREILKNLVNSQHKEYVDFKHPVWPASTPNETRKAIREIFIAYRKYLDSERAITPALPLFIGEPWMKYYDILTKQYVI